MTEMKALLLTPMDASYHRVQDAVERGVRDASGQPVTLDRLLRPGAVWMNAVTDAIQEADVVIADVSRKNPHVLYELGFAHALRKPTLLLLSTDSEGEMPFDLAGYQMLTYDPGNLSPLRAQIEKFLRYRVAARSA